MNPLKAVNEIAKACDGKITEVGILPDNSGFAVMSMPLPKDHWIYGKGEFEAPPMPFRMGSDWRVFIQRKVPLAEPPTIAESEELFQLRGAEAAQLEQLPDGRVIVGARGMTKEEFAEKICQAGRYAVRCATMNGKEMDFDPDALLQNLVVGMLGYWTEDGLSSDEWANPKGA